MLDLPLNDGSAQSASSATAGCSGTLVVRLHWGNNADVASPYMRDSRVLVGGEVTVRVTGPETREDTTTDGRITFADLPCGDYTIDAIYTGQEPLADRARQEIGSVSWNHAPEVTSRDGTLKLDAKTNKCNLFIYDMIQQEFGTAPTYTYARRFTFGQWTRTVPDLASSWAAEDNTTADQTEGWENISYRGANPTPVKPGSILAIAASYGDATGHVAVISYPDPGQALATVQGARVDATVIMQGKTVSADGRSVVENDWGFRTSRNMETSSLNSPQAGIEVKK